MYIYILLTLFFSSLFAIIFMIGKKFALIEHEQILNHEEILFELPFIKEVKKITVANVKRHGYTGLVTTVRIYVRSTNFLQNKYQDLNRKIKNQIRSKAKNGESKEISKFLKVIGDYKHKIREITHKIKKEENL